MITIRILLNQMGNQVIELAQAFLTMSNKCVLSVLYSYCFLLFWSLGREVLAQELMVNELPVLVVSATRSEKRLEEVPIPVEVISASEIQQQNASHLGEALRHAK